PAAANISAISSKSSESRDDEGSSTSVPSGADMAPLRITSIATPSYRTRPRLVVSFIGRFLRSAIVAGGIAGGVNRAFKQRAGVRSVLLSASNRLQRCRPRRSGGDGFDDGGLAVGDGRAMQVAHLGFVISPGTVHRAAVIPHHQVTDLPV